MDLAAPRSCVSQNKIHTHILFVLFLWRTMLKQDLSHVKLTRGLGKVYEGR